MIFYLKLLYPVGVKLEVWVGVGVSSGLGTRVTSLILYSDSFSDITDHTPF